MKDFVEGREAAYLPRVGSGLDDAVETGFAEGSACRNQAERAVRITTRAQIDAAAAVTRKRHLHAGARFAGQPRIRIQPRINHFPGGAKPAQPSCASTLRFPVAATAQ